MSAMPSTRHVLTTMAIFLTLIAMLPASAAGQGNSESARDCQKGGWQHHIDENGSSFNSQGDCVRHGGQGGSVIHETAEPCLEGGHASLAPPTPGASAFASEEECIAHIENGGSAIPLAALPCLDGGWEALAPADSPQTAFASEAACIAHVEDGGSITDLIVVPGDLEVNLWWSPDGTCPLGWSLSNGVPNSSITIVIRFDDPNSSTIGSHQWNDVPVDSSGNATGTTDPHAINEGFIAISATGTYGGLEGQINATASGQTCGGNS